jgi:hypothetical protein
MMQGQTVTSGERSLPSRSKPAAVARRRMRPLGAPMQSQPSDREFVALLPAFRLSGGLATGHEIAARMERAQSRSLATLGQRIASGELISFLWSGNFWLPWFQFGSDMQVTDVAEGVIGELGDVLDGWELTQWFAQPQPSLEGKAPIELVAARTPAVIEAARLARFIARGC